MEALRAARPGPALDARLTRLAGKDDRYGQYDDATVVAAIGRLAAIAANIEARKLLAMAELIRRFPSSKKMAGVAEMPECWEFGLAEQAGLELSVSPGSADGDLGHAWALAVRLPLTLAALRDGTLDAAKARMISRDTSILSDEDAREAEARLAAWGWAGRTWWQIYAKLAKIIINLDPDAVRKRREQAQRDEARVRVWREASGTCALAGFGLPPDQALQADARIQARAKAYRKAGMEGSMDLLRVRAFADILNGTDARHDTAGSGGTLDDLAPDDGAASAGCGTPDGGSDAGPEGGEGQDDTGGDGDDGQDGAGGDDLDGGDGGGPAGSGPDSSGPGSNGGGQGQGTDEYGEGLAARLDLTLPLATLMDLAERAGEAGWYGPADPATVRDLGTAAARNPDSSIRIIITGPDGRAVGFGIARETPASRKRRSTGRGHPPPPGNRTPASPTRPAGHPGTPPDGTAGPDGGSTAGTRFGFAPVPAPATLPLSGPGGNGGNGGLRGNGGWGTWRLTAQGREWDVRLIPLPAPGPCTHEFGTGAYRPGEMLRTLVQVRDGCCALPICGHTPATCEWEHATPWPGGRTCSCNGGLHCKKDHRLKDQARGWSIGQLADGRRRWTTPTGLRYTSRHREYPD